MTGARLVARPHTVAPSFTFAVFAQGILPTICRKIRMRTLIILFGGFVLWASLLAIGKFLAFGHPAATSRATAIFAVIWFVLAAVNLWFGVARAGYSVAEELPIFLLIFLLPVAIAGLVTWKWL
jgi:hypothetical protein